MGELPQWILDLRDAAKSLYRVASMAGELEHASASFGNAVRWMETIASQLDALEADVAAAVPNGLVAQRLRLPERRHLFLGRRAAQAEVAEDAS